MFCNWNWPSQKHQASGSDVKSEQCPGYQDRNETRKCQISNTRQTYFDYTSVRLQCKEKKIERSTSLTRQPCGRRAVLMLCVIRHRRVAEVLARFGGIPNLGCAKKQRTMPRDSRGRSTDHSSAGFKQQGSKNERNARRKTVACFLIPKWVA